MKSLRQSPFNNIRKGYIYIPSDQFGDKRDVFIQRCYRLKRVTLALDDGSFVNNCLISLSCLNEIEFPENDNEVGSTVLCYSDPFSRKLMVFSVFGKENNMVLKTEKDYKLSQISGENKAELILKGDSGEIILNVDSDNEDGGNVFLIVKNNNKTSKLDIKVLGDATIYGENQIILKSVNSITLDAPAVSASSSMSADEDSIVLSPNEKVILFEGSEPLLLGDTTQTNLNIEKQALTDLINAFNNLVPSPVPPGSVDPTWAVLKTVIAAIANRGDYGNIKSEKSFTD